MTEQNYSHFSRFYPSLAVVVRETRALYKGSLCVRFKNVPHDTQGWCIHLYTEQPDRGSRRSGGNKGNTHEDCIHSQWQVGEFGPRVAPTKTETGRSPPVKDRGRKTVLGKEKEGRNVCSRRHGTGALQGPRKEERERKREICKQGPSHESSLFSLPQVRCYCNRLEMWDFPLILSILLYLFPSPLLFFSLFNPCLLYRLVIHCLATPECAEYEGMCTDTLSCAHDLHAQKTDTRARIHTQNRYGISRASIKHMGST